MNTPSMVGKWRLLAGWIALTAVAGAAEDVVVGDFETSSFEGWTTKGDAFGPGPVKGAWPGQMAVEGFQGQGLANSFHGGDGARGTLTSPSFKITHPYVSFLIGGGGFEGKTCLNLVIDGRTVRTAMGPNTQSGGSERLTRQGWEVREFAGRTARLVAVDDATGGWGHVTVDDIRLTDTKPPLWLTDAAREFNVEKNWLHFPIKNGAAKRRVTLTLDGKKQTPLDIELADTGPPDWWGPLAVDGRRGQKIVVTVDRLAEESQALALISQDDVIRGEAPPYHEALRPQFHFSARRGWLNDPNGLVYHDGVWHLFFQHNPYGWNWGNMHWSHATSRDLFRWTEHGIALAPDPSGPMFSGSGVVDWQNTSGFGKDGRPPLVFFYTAAGTPTVQSLAYIADGGLTPVKYQGNPILKELTPGNRDPKVIWHEPTRRWVMVLYVEREKKHFIDFFTSSDLKQWTRRGGLESFFECPDFFELPVLGADGRATGEKWWVLTGASSEYKLGTFDGETFTPTTGTLPGHRGEGFYAAQTYSDAPDGRRVQIGWLRAPSPGMPFNQCMSLPLELRLRATPDGPRLTQLPVQETDALAGPRRHLLTDVPLTVEPGADALDAAAPAPELLRLQAEILPGAAKKIRLRVRGAILEYDTEARELEVNGHRAPVPLHEGKLAFTLYLDRTTLEVFANDGLTYIPLPFIAKADDFDLGLTVEGGAAEVRALTLEALASVWPGH